MIALFSLALVQASNAPAASLISFEKDVLPILNQRCVMCHIPGAAQAGLELYPDPWTRLVGVPSTQSPLAQVEKGNPGRSYLYHKLSGTHVSVGGRGTQMPFQQGPLEPDQLDMIRTWIEQGAEHN